MFDAYTPNTIGVVDYLLTMLQFSPWGVAGCLVTECRVKFKDWICSTDFYIGMSWISDRPARFGSI